MDIIPQLILNSIIAGAIYALVVLGFNLIYGATKFFNLAHGLDKGKVVAKDSSQKLLESGVLERVFVGKIEKDFCACPEI